MGQRLNIEIWNNGKVLANAYYHWSAYTDESANLANKALEYIKNNPMPNDNELLYAIRILEATGAGLTDGEIEYAKSLSALNDTTFAECKGRDCGLLGISENEIKSTRSWCEGNVFIYLDENRLSFDVFIKQDAWEWRKEQREEYENENADFKSLDVVTLNLDDIKFHQWDICKEFLCSREEPFICDLDNYTVVTPIR